MSSFPSLLLLSATLAHLEWGRGGGLFSSSKFSFKGVDFINNSFIVLECCASNCYCSNLCKTGTSTRQPLLHSLCELLYKCLPKLCCSQREKVLYRLPSHNKKNKNLGGGPPPTHQWPLYLQPLQQGRSKQSTYQLMGVLQVIHFILTRIWVAIDLSTCRCTKSPGSGKNNDWES